MKHAALALCVLTTVSLGATPATRPAADAKSAKLYAVSVKITETKDGHTRTLAEPVMVVRDGEEGKFLAGGEASVDDDTPVLEFGQRAQFCVREKGDKLRVSLNVQSMDLAPRNDSGLIVQSSGAQGEMLIRPGETFVMDMGAGRQARVCVMAAGR